ncbi:MAG: ATP-binding cassette domain-containing protein [Clostridia bacterium]|nr:ATP-binding cassette domain-containing protein [Clostridia bacterium]MDD4680532.1 ATP-binding cassette domain-containing protein [Clostridia bacterium]
MSSPFVFTNLQKTVELKNNPVQGGIEVPSFLVRFDLNFKKTLRNTVVKLDMTGRRVINGLNLKVSRGEKIRITGGSGSGKTCLVRLISGMEPPDSGMVSVLGRLIFEMNGDARAEFRSINFGLVSRYPGFLRRLTVLDNAVFLLISA